MTKKQLVSVVAKRTNTTKKNANVMVTAVFETMAEELNKDGRIQITGFGAFEVAERSAREGRNPANGEIVSVEAIKTIRFKASKMLRDTINGKRSVKDVFHSLEEESTSKK